MRYTIRTKSIINLKLSKETKSETLIKQIFSTKNLDDAIKKAKETITLRLTEEKSKQKKYQVIYLEEEITITNNFNKIILHTNLENFLKINENLPF